MLKSLTTLFGLQCSHFELTARQPEHTAWVVGRALPDTIVGRLELNVELNFYDPLNDWSSPLNRLRGLGYKVNFVRLSEPFATGAPAEIQTTGTVSGQLALSIIRLLLDTYAKQTDPN